MKKNNISADDKIITAYWKLAKNNKLTVSNLCKQAQINRSTFYQYYLDIEDLSDKEENKIIEKILNKVNAFFPDFIPNNLSEFTKLLIDIFTKYSDELYILLNNSSNFLDKITKELSIRIPIVFNIKTTDVHLKYITTYLISNICSLLKCWYDNNKDLSIEELAILIHKLVFNGLELYKEK